MILIHIAELLSYLREFDDAKKMNLGFIGSLMTVSCSLEGLVGSFYRTFYEPKTNHVENSISIHKLSIDNPSNIFSKASL